MDKVTVKSVREMKAKGQKITMLTAYDYAFANILDGAGVDILLVGDSLGMVTLGYDDTLPVTVEDMMHHTKAVVRGTKRAMVVTDMPFMSYQVSDEKAMENVGNIMKFTGTHALKLEGGERIVGLVKRMTDAGIPVMGHLGLTPQSILQFGGYGLQASSIEEAQRLLSDAIALEEAGAFALVLEKIPSELAELVTASLEIPTIGIGAGPACDGQVLVVNDMLGMFEKFVPKFVKQYANLRAIIDQAAKDYINDVRGDVFPAGEQTFHMDKETLGNFMEEIDRGLGRK
ncbi:MAG: 3-methyl-2-oxobutanoate hydroxymethyltransferase [Candidatus Aquicultor secundus]|uniref:3-methyl-2-oxobutanoate hydroxymethyltransferase n=1 Tax=Candidatus Aquicultor secundus TaxID=1973895 RepID=A0A2M7T8R5_9ACTN|nr:3-methyl-2-oxobutanoate hydroxymethyltransferase [Candidatus Aquicultor secundus]NCO66625.1 3-methyl-2-oxobutanoate hydroxymethyltransferase [Solirubrobacter sp.]OIO83590.1 MAG: 3-methyl-2-oxobutanoate hydroxymethyltransferase [Candidatus Aquicultor secundus]PIU26031.1 MAG: 3-methyl-2-oxobutanoate hydroxymethyltransferase [Candidatus Aquicultor secundus]PIW22595.1 MAG: 3-methyl-2-oxobutanoate hydroxymethyltransferase [Candidatus Aquicultor secundus]PIX51247.1 MAG: 3-methyl-2-oxobutanoate hy